MTRRRRQAKPAHGRIKGCEKLILRMHGRTGQCVEERRLAGIGIAYQRNDGERYLLARRTMQPACATHLIEILAQTHETLVDHAAIGLDLGFTRTAKKAKATALALQMGPEPDKTRSLIF